MNIVNLNYHIIIPARGGSKRFPKKNIHLLDGIPLISHSIKFALETFPHKNIWVNTDDHEIAKIGLSFGVNVTMRPDNLGSDTASTADVLYYQQEIFDSKQINCEAMILLQVTNPLRPRKLILDAILAFEKNKRTSLATFTKLNRKFGKIKSGYYFPENYIPGQRMQDIEPEYFENGLRKWPYLYCKKTSD